MDQVLLQIKKSGIPLTPKFIMFEYSTNKLSGITEIYVSYHIPAEGSEDDPHPHDVKSGCCQHFEYSTQEKLVQNYSRMMRCGGRDYLEKYWLSNEDEEDRHPPAIWRCDKCDADIYLGESRCVCTPCSIFPDEKSIDVCMKCSLVDLRCPVCSETMRVEK